MIFKNRRWQRDRNCTNVVACEMLGDKLPDSKNWVSDDIDLSRLTPLYVQGGFRYWGYL